MYDLIILDTSANYLDPLLEEVVYPVSDSIICVTDMDISSVIGIARWIYEITTPKDLGGSGVSPSKLGITINKAMSNINMSLEKIRKVAGDVPILGVLPCVPTVVAYSRNTASLELLFKQSQINDSLKTLAEIVLGDLDYQLSSVPKRSIEK